MPTLPKDQKLIAKMEQMFTTLGIEAIQNHPKSDLYAEVNPVDKFILVMRGEVEDVILDEVSRFASCWQWDWWDDMNNKPWNEAHNSKFAAFVNHIAEQAYGKIKA